MQLKQSYSTGFKTTKTSFQILKETKEHFCKQKKTRSRKMKKYKFLKDQIYKNHNIFQSLANIQHFNRTLTAQNIVWTKNYQLKQEINSLKEENSSLKARIWNIEKQNRKMDRQIESWGLIKVFNNLGVGKPYIDSETIQKVFHDQDYSITSTKIQIMQLERVLGNKVEELEQKILRQKNVKKISSLLKTQLQKKKMALYEYFYKDKKTDQLNSIAEIQQKNRVQLKKKEDQIQQIKSSTSMKKSERKNFEQELQALNSQLLLLRHITPEQIENLKEQAQKLRIEDENYVNQETKKLEAARENYAQLQTQTQEKMGQFIRQKIDLTQKIEKYQGKIYKLNKKMII